jgi:arsenate reductase-like glutaredoxin family protein
MITVYTISTCKLCKQLLNELVKLDIKFNNVDIDSVNPVLADRLEALVQSTYYPMVNIQTGDANRYIVSKVDGDKRINVSTFDSLPHLISLITKHI